MMQLLSAHLLLRIVRFRTLLLTVFLVTAGQWTAADSSAHASFFESVLSKPLPAAATSRYFAQSRPPASSRLPRGTVSGATRTEECKVDGLPVSETYIRHLFPASNNPTYSSFTERESPILWIYSPYALDENSPIRVQIQRVDTRSIVYDSGVIAAGNGSGGPSGLVGLNAPVDLEPDVGYLWQFMAYCNDSTQTRSPQSLMGGLMYLPQNAVPDTEHWYDTLNTLIESYQQSPIETVADWVEMIDSVELTDLPHTSVTTIIELPVEVEK
ncbi:MAG: protein of unknown function (DUF928) [Phormidesmis priestleyi Ana]|uniref:DUF928 domain-containing protein n=1 Tax=Phormidesmis priestleyi Ana TaxID=1666911 RepID=A0A0P8BWN9_9CYAN|nr:MAG: protein of unknown function (DUF928) [Phormidesmis priestleyi Ana]